MEISLSNRQKRVAIDPAKLRRAAKKILSVLGCKDAEISIVVVDDAEITRLNRRYFRRPGPTNVISFPLQEGKPGNLQAPLLGDVVISADTAARHARAAGVRTGDEILFLLVHGVLHLVGYDHEGPAAERREMEAKEREIFGGLVNGLKKGVKGPRG
jgi:probable rRNA maturation factor